MRDTLLANPVSTLDTWQNVNARHRMRMSITVWPTAASTVWGALRDASSRARCDSVRRLWGSGRLRAFPHWAAASILVLPPACVSPPQSWQPSPVPALRCGELSWYGRSSSKLYLISWVNLSGCIYGGHAMIVTLATPSEDPVQLDWFSMTVPNLLPLLNSVGARTSWSSFQR